MLLVSFCVLVSGSLPGQQAPGSPATFAVATIRPSPPDALPLTQIRGNRFATEGTTFVDVFKYAYDVHPDQVVGGPEWIRTQKFSILADPETEVRPTSDQMKAMVRQLLVERFHVVMHQERKMLSVYALVKTADPARLTKTTTPPGIPVVAYSPKGELHVGNATMPNFATFLQRFVLDRPAVDQTGIDGRFDLKLRWTPDNLRPDGKLDDSRPESSAPPGLFTAIQEQLGLKLQPTKAPTEVFVIDHIEHPAES